MELNVTPDGLHPSELAYALTYARAPGIVGWGEEPFRPEREGDEALAEWLAGGAERLLAAGRLTGTREEGLNFSDDMTAAVLALVNPAVVLLAQRKAGEGVSTLTVHAAGDDFVGLTRNRDGMFELTRYADLTAAAAACAGFVGASLEERDAQTRVETDQEAMSRLSRLARAGETAKVAAALVELGAPEPEAASAAQALAAPAAAGVVSVLYCRNGAVADTEAFSTVTNAQDQTWIVFAPASLEGPVILERSSAAALAARIAVGVFARLGVPG